jgi:hypothetical protein
VSKRDTKEAKVSSNINKGFGLTPLEKQSAAHDSVLAHRDACNNKT